jgi:hypothetical protein
MPVVAVEAHKVQPLELAGLVVGLMDWLMSIQMEITQHPIQAVVAVALEQQMVEAT